MTTAIPMPFHTSMAATESNAMFGSVSHPGPSAPVIELISLLTIPWNGSSSTWKVMPTPTADTRTGKNVTERR